MVRSGPNIVHVIAAYCRRVDPPAAFLAGHSPGVVKFVSNELRTPFPDRADEFILNSDGPRLRARQALDHPLP